MFFFRWFREEREEKVDRRVHMLMIDRQPSEVTCMKIPFSLICFEYIKHWKDRITTFQQERHSLIDEFRLKNFHQQRASSRWITNALMFLLSNSEKLVTNNE